MLELSFVAESGFWRSALRLACCGQSARDASKDMVFGGVKDSGYCLERALEPIGATAKTQQLSYTIVLPVCAVDPLSFQISNPSARHGTNRARKSKYCVAHAMTATPLQK
ncbi:hypothetical protein P3T24_002112 [Paraburkholderia sp. GAS33]